MGRLWSWGAGERGLNRIRVYERRADGPIYVEWYDSEGRHQKSFRDLIGIPVFDKNFAKQLAVKMSEAQRKKREARTGAKLLGLPEPHTLGELFKAYHDANPVRTAENPHGSWSEKYAGDQKRSRAFWEGWLGADMLVTEVTAARAEAAMRKAQASLKMGDRTMQKRVRYLKDAYTFARRKLKWIGEEHDLSALDVPSVEHVSQSYTTEEARRLLPATERVDLRVAAMAYIAWTSGRRSEAIRTLPESAYSVEGDFGVIQFPGATDKARRSGRVYIAGRAKRVVEALLEQPAVRATGLLFPSGELDSIERPREALSDTWLRKLLRDAEEIAKVPSLPGRAFHGLKRRYATAALAHDPQAASKQSGTLRQTLEHHYEQDDPESKAALATHLDTLLEVKG